MTKHNLIFLPYSQRLKMRLKDLQAKRALLLLLCATFISYPKDVHSNICSQIFNLSHNRQEKSAEKKMGPIRQRLLEFVNPKEIENSIREQLDLKESPDPLEFFERHHTQPTFLQTSTIWTTLIEPITTSPGKRTVLKRKIEDYIKIQNQFNFNKLSPEFLTEYTKALVFLMSEYLAANGVTHSIIDRIPKPDFTDTPRTFTIEITPNHDTPLGRLAQDFYNRYNGGRIKYDPLTLIHQHSGTAYNFIFNIIKLPNNFLLNTNTVKDDLLHELLHAKIHRDFEQNPESPYNLSLSGKFLLKNKGYRNYVSFSEMITYQQTLRILLRRLTANSKSTIYKIDLENFIRFANLSLKISQSIETALSKALHFLDQEPNNYDLTPVIGHTGKPILKIPLTATKIRTFSGVPGRTYLNIPTTHQKETYIQVPFHPNGNDTISREMVIRRLESALETVRAHKNRYLVLKHITNKIDMAREIELFSNGFFLLSERRKEERRAKYHEREVLLLRALQSSQILSQRFNSEISEESVKQLIDRVKIALENLH